MSVDMFLKIDDIKGEASDDSHGGEIKVLSWAWGMTQSASTHEGAGGGAGRVSVQDITVTKYVDKSTPNLIKMCCAGTHFTKALLIVRKAGGKKPLEYIKIEMSDGIIAAVNCGGSSDGDLLTEQVALNFGSFKYEYVPQKSDGTGEASIPAGWDIAKNAPK